MDIIHVAVELAPVAKAGGLGDVLFGLSRACADQGHRVEVFMPKFDCLATDKIENLHVIEPSFSAYFEGKWVHNKVWQGRINGFSVILFESNDMYGFFNRGTIYGCPDDSDRFLYFCRLVLDYLEKTKRRPDVLHLHDWHAASIATLQRFLFPSSPIKTVLTLHNMAYQGITSSYSLDKVGIQPGTFTGDVNLMKEGITYADIITTVSPTYAREILTKAEGMGLDAHLQKHQDKLFGILNGIDENFWNPKTDPVLSYHYSARDIVKETHPFIENKGKLQNEFRENFSLTKNQSPIVSCVTRLVPQKSPELIKHALRWTLDQGGQFVLLGIANDPIIHEEFAALKRELNDNRSVHIELTYNESLSHLIYGVTDLLIIPSLFEPCGLTQMIGMRYGALPLVRKTGGLADTVFEGENGFVFGPHTKKGIEEALQRAFHCYFHEPSKWRNLLQKAMNTTFNWNESASLYLSLYSKTLHPTS